MRPSSSSTPAPVPDAATEVPPCVDKFIVGSPRLLPLCAGGPERSSTLALDSGGASERGTQIVSEPQASSGEEYASGEMDSGSDGSGDSWEEGRTRHAEAWVSPGRPELSERLLFAFIEPPVPMLNVSSFIREALRSVAPLLPVDLLPSSMGAMLLRCESHEARNSLHLLGPIHCGGSMLHLYKPEDTPNRFFRVPVWLAFVFVVGFPNEHWYEDKIKDFFRGFAEVAEVDPECLTGENFGPLRLLLEVNDRLDIPRELRISSRLGVGRAGAVATVIPIRVWPREFQLDSRGNRVTFFGPPAPPGTGPALGPMGPVSSQQQLRPQPHYFNLGFPPNSSSRYAGNLQRAFDPLHCSAVSGTAASSTPAVQVMASALLLARLMAGPPDGAASAREGSPVSSAPRGPQPCADPGQAAVAQRPLITYQRRQRLPKAAHASSKACKVQSRACRESPVKGPRRSSKRLAAKATDHYIDMTSQAVQRKALLNSLSTCSLSLSLKAHVKKRNILSRNLLPLGAAELRKLISAAKIGNGGDAGAAASGVTVPAVAE